MTRRTRSNVATGLRIGLILAAYCAASTIDYRTYQEQAEWEQSFPMMGREEVPPLSGVAPVSPAGVLLPSREPDRLVPFTVYHTLFDGRGTANGDTYYHDGMSVAIPRALREEFMGKDLLIEWHGRQVVVRCNDVTALHITRNFDLSGAAWDALTNGMEPTRVKEDDPARVWILEDQG